MNEQELNKKLAEWAGLLSFKDKLGSVFEYDRKLHEDPPNFCQSLDACFKWLVPKLDYAVIAMNVAPSGDVFWNAHIEAEYETVNTSETPALALCLAIERLTNKEVVTRL